MFRTLTIALISAAVIGWASGAAAGEPYTPAGAERKAILDALRQPVQHDLKQAVEFVVSTMKASDKWVFVIANPRRPGGGSLRWAGTMCEGDQSHLVGALLQEKAPREWTVVAYDLCPTDVPWVDWPKEYGAPAGLFE